MKLVSLIEREERIQSTPQELAFLRNCTDLKRAIHSNEPLATKGSDHFRVPGPFEYD